MGGGGKTGIDALARASGRSPPHGGVYFWFREREGKAFGVLVRDRPAIQQTSAPLQRREADGGPARAQVRQRASGNERGKSACGLAQECRALRSAECAGQSASTRNSRSTSNAPDRHPNGPGLQPRSAPADRAGRPKGQPFRPYTNSLSASLQNQLENPPQILQTGIEQIANKIVSQGCHSGIKTTPCRKLSQR